MELLGNSRAVTFGTVPVIKEGPSNVRLCNYISILMASIEDIVQSRTGLVSSNPYVECKSSGPRNVPVFGVNIFIVID